MQKKHLVGYPVATLVAFAIGAAGSASTPAPTTAAPASAVSPTPSAPAPTVTVPATPAPTPDATPTPDTTSAPAGVPGDGTYEVGVDIQPGKYSSDTPTSGNCYWARLKNDDPFDGILANNNSSGQSVVIIKKTDKYFQSSGCSDWTKR